MNVVGIDPGAKGAAAYIYGEHDLSWIRFAERTDRKTTHDLGALLRHHRGSTFLEKVHSMPTDGKQTAFVFGRNYGLVLATCYCADHIPNDIDPKTWQFEFDLGAIDRKIRKQAHQAKARELFPEVAKQITLDVADAILIAEYGWRKENGKLQPKKVFDGSVRGSGVIRTTEFRER